MPLISFRFRRVLQYWVLPFSTFFSLCILGCNSSHKTEDTYKAYVQEILGECSLLIVRYSDSHGAVQLAVLDDKCVLDSISTTLTLGSAIHGPELWKSADQVVLDLWVFSHSRPPQSLRVSGPFFLLLGVQGYELGFQITNQLFFDRLVACSREKHVFNSVNSSVQFQKHCILHGF